MLRAGTALIEISPGKGVQLAGYPHCPRPNTGVHDPLYAAALVLDNGVVRKAFLCLDLLSIGKRTVERLRAKFPFDITVSVTHTHSGPWASEPLASEIAEGIRQNPDYMAFLEARMEQAVREASENLFEASFASGVGHCGREQGVGGNRRVKDGLQDPSVNVMAVRDARGVVRAAFLNYALHPTFLHAENARVSADYPGYIRRFLKFAHPEAVFLFAQGTSGDQSSRYHRVGQDFDEAARVGTTLGVEVFHTIGRLEFSDRLDIAVESFTVEGLPMKRHPPLEEALAAERAAVAAFEAATSADYTTRRNAELAMFGAQNTVAFARLAAAGYSSPELPLEVQVVRLGDTCIVAIQAEAFVEFGLAIKAASPAAKTFVLEASNGYAPGYLYTEEAGREGGYEVGTSMFASGAGDQLVRKIKEKLTCSHLK
ncbi:MAG: hypothetical protein ACOX9C_00595 [Kiritimatiellia bacterium]|jgi:neutral ceramidase